MEEKLNLYQKMLKITEEIGIVAKNLQVRGMNGEIRYNAVGETDILDKVKPLEIKYGIYSFPFSRQYVDLQMEKKVALRVETIYRFINVDNPSEYLDIVSYGDGVDSQDKAPGKAMTYSDKYALMKAYKISTGEDPDQEASPEPKISKKQATYLKDILTGHDALHLKMLATYNVSKIENLTLTQASEAIERVKRNLEIREQKAKTEVTPVIKEAVSAVKEEINNLTGELTKTEPKQKETKSEEPKIEETKQEVQSEEVKMSSAVQRAKIIATLNEERRTKMLKALKHTTLDELTEAEANGVLEKLKREAKK